MILPGQEIPISDKLRLGLATELRRLIGDYETQYSRLFKDIETHWRWYEATPKTAGPKNFPFKGASNIVVPLIQIMADTYVNKAYASIFSQRDKIWNVRTENEGLDRQTVDVGRWLNWASNNNDFSMRLPAYDQLLEMAVVGSSVIGLNWRQDVRWAYSNGRSGKLKAQQVRYARGAFPEHIPREQILWDTNYLIQEAPAVIRELNYSWSELRNLAELDTSWDKKGIEELQGQGRREGPSQQVQRSKDVEDSRTPSLVDSRAQHDIREVHLEWPMLDRLGFSDERVPKPGRERMSTPSPPIVATLDRNKGPVLRLIAEPYYFPYKPFFDIFYRKRSGRGHSAGMAKKLEHMQRSMTTTLNQAHDSRTRANAVWAKTKRKDYLSKPLDPSTMIYDPDMNSVEAFKLDGGGTFDDMRLLTAINTIAERQTGMSDPAMGRETRQGGHPSPATTTLFLAQQSDIMQGTTKELVRLQYGRMGEAIASLYQQFETNEDGKLQRVFGEEDAGRIEEFLFPSDPVSGTLMFDVTSMSEKSNPQDDMNRAILVSQMNQNYWLSVTRAVALLESPQTPPLTKQVIIKAIRAGTKSHLKFLESGDVDDLERYVLSLAEDERAGADDLRTASNRVAEIAAGRVDTGNGGLGGNGSVVGGGASIPNGGLTGLT